MDGGLRLLSSSVEETAELSLQRKHERRRPSYTSSETCRDNQIRRPEVEEEGVLSEDPPRCDSWVNGGI